MTTPRIIALGDIHADLEAAKEALRLANIVDHEGQWIAQNTILVQTGDLTDRGPNGKSLLLFIKDLEKQALAHNSQFITLIGNHEAMNLLGDWRYVSPEDISEFGGIEERKKAFSQDGMWAEWILQHNAVAKVQNTVFVHGGITEEYAKLGIDTINETIKMALQKKERAPILGSDGPLWFRGYVNEPETTSCAHLKKTLTLLQAKRMVVGHTTQRNGIIASRCKGALLVIDTGISKHYGNHISVLDISDDDAKAIYIEKNTDLPDPF